MSQVWFCSDWHLDHENMAMKYRQDMRFKSIEEHNYYFLEQWKKHVDPIRDVVFCLGDMAVTKESFAWYDTLGCQSKHLILGNHDLDHGTDIIDICHHFDGISGPKRYKNFWLTHFPIHGDELYGKYNIHGHTHDTPNIEPYWFNCSPERLIPAYGRPLVKLQEINEYFRSIKDRASN